MKIKVVILFAFLCFGVNSKTHAQKDDELIAHLQLEKINLLGDYLSTIGNPNVGLEVRKYYVPRALSLFVNNGASYTIDESVVKGAHIEINNEYRTRPIKRLVKDYINGLLNSRYEAIKVENATFAIVKSGNLKFDDMSGKYIAKAIISQNFKGFIDGKPIYDDIVNKTIQFYLDKEYVESLGETPYIVLLVDIQATESKNDVGYKSTDVFADNKYKTFVKTKNKCSKCDCNGYWGYKHNNGTYEGNCSNSDGHGHTCNHGPEKHGLRKW